MASSRSLEAAGTGLRAMAMHYQHHADCRHCGPDAVQIILTMVQSRCQGAASGESAGSGCCCPGCEHAYMWHASDCSDGVRIAAP